YQVHTKDATTLLLTFSRSIAVQRDGMGTACGYPFWGYDSFRDFGKQAVQISISCPSGKLEANNV
ncbi:MAG: hypothetical protein PUG54_00235, partial [Firmicutes bacterium]|nr:hypothetical protein [Bacillota bacterium]